MARRNHGEDEVTEGVEPQGEGAAAGAEFVPEAALKPKSDVYTVLLILTFIAFLAGAILSGREAWEHYDVQFWVFSKKPRAAEAAPAPAEQPSAEPAAEPAPQPQ
jgi:hypothetical protein